MQFLTELKVIVATMRLRFLFLTLVVVLLSVSLVFFEGHALNYEKLFLVMIAALLAHVSVNMLNEYEDWKSNLDSLTIKTPFSGGSGSLQSVRKTDQPRLAQKVKWLGYGGVAFTTLLGVYFVSLGLWLLLPIGFLGLFLVLYYTTFITKHPWLCLIAPGLAFGPLMMVGTYIVLVGSINPMIVFLSFIPFFLVNNLLLLNQVPDIKADKKVGRNNLWMLLDEKIVFKIVSFFYFCVFALLAFLSFAKGLPKFILMPFLFLPWIFWLMKPSYWQAVFDQPKNLTIALRHNVMISHFIPLTISLVLITFKWING